MATRASGQELIEHKSFIVDNLGEHFNNPDISDASLAVGDQVFAAHRLILATQSKVFKTMLMGESWKESEEKKITLQESPQGEAAFSDFLKFFYTGTLTPTIDNVCGIHTLTDKYDVSVLKDDSVDFMEEVLTGVHGDALKAGLEWLQYTEAFLPDMVSICYSAIRTNFTGVCTEEYKDAFWKLNLGQIKTIFSDSEVSEELALLGEENLQAFMKGGKWTQKLLPYIRFYNISIDQLRSIETENKLTKPAKLQLTTAYKIHAERCDIASRACKRQSLVQVSCPCDSPSAGNMCPHINPRLYFKEPFGKYTFGTNETVEPIDLSDLAGFSQKMLFREDKNDEAAWSVTMTTAYSVDPIYESYEVIPADCHIGRRFTLAIACVKYSTTEECVDPLKHQYTIKFSGVVAGSNDHAKVIALISPFRFQDSWKISKEHALGVSILLHK